LSRSRIFALTTLDNEHLLQVAQQAINDPERGYGKLDLHFADEALEHLVEMANGDARALLNALELAVQTTEPDPDGRIHIDRTVAEESIQKKAVLYDKDGDAHYDVISAFIKSVRGSDPDAALYWLAKMVYAGEDPRFIFRRMLILASEDIGMADPHALTVVASAARTFDYVGLPEGRFALAHACVYLATAPKSNSLFAFFSALESVGKEREGEVPDHLKDAARDGEDLGHGRDYLYPHAYRDHWVAQQYLPASLQGRTFYQPGNLGYEEGIKAQVERRREEQLAAFLEERDAQYNPLNEIFFAAHCHSPGKVQSQWLKRTLANTGKRLGEVRDAMYRAAACGQDARILTINDNTGLLIWEGLRQAPQGGVYALFAEAEAAAMIKEQAENLDPLDRPVLIAGGLNALKEHCRREQGLAFDVMLARGMKRVLEGNDDGLARLGAMLAPAGRIICAESLPRFNQRLYRLLPESALSAEIRDALALAEEAIYAHADLDWCEEDTLRQRFDCPALRLRKLHLEQSRHQVYISRDEIDNWFTPRSEGEKKAYCQHLADHVDEQALSLIQTAFRSHLTNKVCRWESVTAYLVLER
ncbi:MAG: AAA family ATPase, partial [Desulfobulbaceae bacterium]|nr:AAA family ATPase [Desulfobulbaceae bacterium]